MYDLLIIEHFQNVCVVWTSSLHFQIYSMNKDTLSAALQVSMATEGFSPKAVLGFQDSALRGRCMKDRDGEAGQVRAI